jgi:hypothetical protein
MDKYFCGLLYKDSDRWRFIRDFECLCLIKLSDRSLFDTVSATRGTVMVAGLWVHKKLYMQSTLIERELLMPFEAKKMTWTFSDRLYIFNTSCNILKVFFFPGFDFEFCGHWHKNIHILLFFFMSACLMNSLLRVLYLLYTLCNKNQALEIF